MKISCTDVGFLLMVRIEGLVRKTKAQSLREDPASACFELVTMSLARFQQCDQIP